MRMALADAGVGPEAVDYVNAHGTSTPVGDRNEVRVMRMALGEERRRAHRRSPPPSRCTGTAWAPPAASRRALTALALREG